MLFGVMVPDLTGILFGHLAEHIGERGTEDERAWAYDQELDLLHGGKHLQMGNPYAFPDGAPTLSGLRSGVHRRARSP